MLVVLDVPGVAQRDAECQLHAEVKPAVPGAQRADGDQDDTRPAASDIGPPGVLTGCIYRWDGSGMTTTEQITTETVRVLVAIDVPVEQARDIDDLLASVYARVCDEAGYLDPDDAPITPVSVCVGVVADDTILTRNGLEGVYEVGIDGVNDFHEDACAIAQGTDVNCTCEG